MNAVCGEPAERVGIPCGGRKDLERANLTFGVFIPQGCADYPDTETVRLLGTDVIAALR